MEAQSPAQSPKNEVKGTMDFPNALKAVIEGKRIHKLEWKDKGYYGFLNEKEILTLHKPGGSNHQWIISLGDMIGDDYIVL